MPLAEVVAGDCVVVRPGERIPVDGVVREGAYRTSTSRCSPAKACRSPRAWATRVTGGAINGEGRAVSDRRAVGAETVLARIIRLVEDAQAAKAPIQRLVDRVSAVFVPAVLGIAALTLRRLAGWPAWRRDGADPTRSPCW